MILILEGILSYVIIFLIINLLVKKRNILKQRKILMVLEGYILAGLIFSTLNLLGGSYIIGISGFESWEIYINFILHLCLVPFAWLVLIKKTK